MTDPYEPIIRTLASFPEGWTQVAWYAYCQDADGGRAPWRREPLDTEEED